MPSIDKTANCPKRPRRRQKPTLAITLVADQRIVLACRLDRNADLLLSLNCHIAVASRMWWKWPDWRVSGVVMVAWLRPRGQPAWDRSASRRASATRPPCA